jgi:hypothetical protein
MSGTVEFNYLLQRQAAEVRNGIAHGDLAPKLIVKQLAIAKKPPSNLLR